MAEKAKEQRGVTRRQFMKVVPIGIASALVVSVISGRIGKSLFRQNQGQTQLPEDSIFTPAKGQRDQT